MGGTAVENLPGGLLDHLVGSGTGPGLAAVRTAAVAGAYATALEAARPLAGFGPGAAWYHYAWYHHWLALPDGGARLPVELAAGPEAEPPRTTPQAAAGVEELIVGYLLTQLRELRAMLSPQLPIGPNERAWLYTNATRVVDHVRRAYPDRVDLAGHLDLLLADVAARAGSVDAARTNWQNGWQRLSAARDEPGLAAAALLVGDLHVAPLTSPLSWNCVLYADRASAAGTLTPGVELAEFDGLPGHLVDATAAYDDAESRYARLGDRAGLAAVLLRRGYLALLAGDPGAAVEQTGRAAAEFETTSRHLDAAIAATHQALAAIADDRPPADTRIADLLTGAAGRSIGYGPAYGLGLLCARMGRHWAGKGHQPERAQAALGLAERLWDRTAERDLRVQALLGIGEAAIVVGDVAAARSAALAALDTDRAPLAEPADPTDLRRVRRILLAMLLYRAAVAASDVAGMAGARELLETAVGPLRARLSTFDGVARTVATQLVEHTDLQLRPVTELVFGARQALDEGDPERAGELFAAAHDALRTCAAVDRDFDEAVLLAFEGDRSGASDAFERYATRALHTVPNDPREIHAQGLTFQIVVGAAERAREHRLALAATADPWWSGTGPHWLALGTEGRLLELEGNLPAAHDALAEALREAERVRATLARDSVKTAFLGTSEIQDVHLGAARVALRLAERSRSAGDRYAADRWAAIGFESADRAQSRALLDLVTANVGATRAGLPADLVGRWRAAAAAVALGQGRLARIARQGGPASSELPSLRTRLAEARSQLDSVESELRDANPRFWAAINPQATVAGLDSVAAALPDGVTLLQYAVGRTDLLAWAVTRDGVVASHRLTGDHHLHRLVAQTVAGCAGKGPVEAPAARLAELLVEPLRAAIEPCSALLVVPGGPLMRLPFEVLAWDGAPLGTVRPLTVLPGASMLRTGTRSDPLPGSPLVVGDPAGPDGPGRGSPLPGARAEAASVARLLAGSTLLVGAQASPSQVRRALADAPVIHLATHAVLDPTSPLGSAIVLADGGELTVAELFGQRLRADLMVLSGCRTGAGAVAGGELLGFGRALVTAGVRTTVLTRWAVDDCSAALLMTEFHRCRRAGLPDPVALRSARRYLRGLDRDSAVADYARLRATAEAGGDATAAEQVDRAVRDLRSGRAPDVPYAHPYHWAPFVLISTAADTAVGGPPVVPRSGS